MPLLTLGLLMFTDGYLAHRLWVVCLPLRVAFHQHFGTRHLAVDSEARGVISDWDIRKSKRTSPGLSCWCWPITSWLMCLVVQSTAVAVPVFYQQVLLSLVVAIASAWVVTWKAKISMHMLAQGGILAVYLHVAMMDHTWDLNWVSVLLLSAGLVGWSRLRLGAHTPAQVYSGFALGLLTVWITLF